MRQVERHPVPLALIAGWLLFVPWMLWVTTVAQRSLHPGPWSVLILLEGLIPLVPLSVAVPAFAISTLRQPARHPAATIGAAILLLAFTGWLMMMLLVWGR